MKEKLLQQILNGEASKGEKKEFYLQLEKDKEKESQYFEMKSLLLHATLHNTKVDVDSEFKSFWRKIEICRIENSLLIGRKILQYAAIVITMLSIGAAAGYFIAQNNFEYPDSGIQKYTATRGSVSIVEFPDGTKVWLNSESKLSFQKDNIIKQRIVELIGEAYFEVAHNDELPFIVKVGGLIVRDLGTTFNIKAYPEDKFIETSLVEGKADILTESGKTILELKPGESAMYYSEDNKMELRTIANNVLSAWRDGKFVIRDQRLEDIFKELSRWYGVEFQFENEKLRNYRFTGNIKKSTTALLVLKMLKTTTDFKYRIVENVEKPDVIIVY